MSTRQQFTLAAAQLGPASSDRLGTRERILELVRQAAEKHVDLICFPELALSSYFAVSADADASEYALTLNDPFLTPIADAARETSIDVVLPLAERDGATIYNSAVLIGRDGKFRGTYRKLHIPPGFALSESEISNHERLYFGAGNLGLPVFDLGYARLGILICYDRFFPEAARALALEGAEILCCPSNNRGYGSEWAVDALRTIMKARAYENGSWVISACKAGIESGQRFVAASLIASPIGGQVLAEATTDGDELVAAPVDRTDVVRARRRINWARDRRPDQYGRLVR